jgi:general secretion pathway protein H
MSAIRHPKSISDEQRMQLSSRVKPAISPGASAGKSLSLPRNTAGFTLVELLVVMVIAALILGLVGTSISRNITGAEMRSAASKLAASLRYTRTRAILDKQEHVFMVDAENRSYQAPKREEVILPEGMNVALTTARSELTAENVGGIRFYPDGGSTGGFVELDANGRIYRINVAWLTGEASIQREED